MLNSISLVSSGARRSIPHKSFGRACSEVSTISLLSARQASRQLLSRSQLEGRARARQYSGATGLFKMAWRCTGATNAELINNLFDSGIIESNVVRDAMLGVDRAHYAPRNPYSDSPQGIGHAATISAPHMHAHAAEALMPSLSRSKTDGSQVKVLDIGSGSGYLTHVLARIVANNSAGGKVIGIDHIRPLVDMATKNMRKSTEGTQLLDSAKVSFVLGDGRKGFADEAPYDAIHVGAAAAGWHEELLDQLARPGQMFIPVEDGGSQYIYMVEKDVDGKVTRKKMFGVSYVPLTDAPN